MSGLVRFSETLRGFVAPLRDLTQSHEAHALAGRKAGTELIFMLTVVTADVDAMVADPRHRSAVFGCVLAPVLSPRPLRVERGTLDLFVDASDPPGRVLHMHYSLTLVDDAAGDGETRVWTLRGIKEVVRSGLLAHPTRDTTTLFVDVWRAEAPTSPVLRGVVKEGLVGVVAQGLSFRGDPGGIVRFLRYYVARVARVVFGPQTAPLRPQWSTRAALER